MKPFPIYRTSLIGIAAFLLGLFLSRDGIVVWDDWEHIRHSQWLLSHFGGTPPSEDPTMIMKWYGPLWEIIMGVFSFVVFGFLKDPAAVRHALTFALFPLTLWFVYLYLQGAGVSKSRSLLAIASLFGLIRWGGHALINTKDFPFSAAFLLVTLALWTDLKMELERKSFSPWIWVKIGIFSIVPYLLRPPVTLHFVGLCIFLGALAVIGPPPNRTRWLKALGISVLSALIFTLITYPTIRELGFGMWMDSFRLFGQFPWIGPVRYYGEVYRSDQLPHWYAFGWIPLVMLWPVFFLVLVGLGSAGLKKSAKQSSELRITLAGRSLSFTLRSWIALITALAWLAVLVKNPVLYDEERHLLFLYPPLVLLAVLYCPAWKALYDKGAALFICLLALWSYGNWGHYSYVYQSPLMGRPNSLRFMGDYWGACVGPAMTALKGRVPAQSSISIIGPAGIGPVQLQRLNESLLLKDSGYEGFHFVDISKLQKPVTIIGINRIGMTDQLQQAVAVGAAQKVLEVDMPPEDVACLAVFIK